MQREGWELRAFELSWGLGESSCYSLSVPQCIVFVTTGARFMWVRENVTAFQTDASKAEGGFARKLSSLPETPVASVTWVGSGSRSDPN